MNGIKHALELLADYVEAVNAHIEAPEYSPALEAAYHRADDALFNLDPAALRALALSVAEESA